ncbi:MAG: N-acetylmuramoyl-L-alanine amidase [Fimbriimonadaceae bacterium]|nr:N-acetylmuramoyl-L-alanine amidase [Fimbriimonadaceae bacterium]
MAHLKPEWLQDCKMSRVIAHWTAGAHKASSLDKAHYHFIVEEDGKVIKGDHDVKDNVNTGDGDYAAHTKGTNTGSIGVSVACMAGARQSPFSAGSFPMTRTQWLVMAEVVAELCAFYKIKVTPTTVLGHGEVERNLGRPQAGKWDPMVLPWDTTMRPNEVGDTFRSIVQAKLDGADAQADPPINVTFRISGHNFDALMMNESVYVPFRKVATAMAWVIPFADGSKIRFVADGAEHEVESILHQGSGFVSVRDLANAIGKAITWDGPTKTAEIG